MNKLSSSLLLLSLFATSGCAPSPSVECVTRNVPADRIPLEAVDCGSLYIAGTDGVNSVENPETLACANRAISASVPFVVRRNEVVSTTNCGSTGMCPLVRAAVSAWIGDTIDGSYAITQLFDGADPSIPSMPLRMRTRSCAPSAGATLRLVSPSTRRISLLCRDGMTSVELDELPSVSACARRDE
jgi:hypothetical protein